MGHPYEGRLAWRTHWTLTLGILCLVSPSFGDVCTDHGGLCVASNCCAHGHYVNTGCNTTTVCCLTQPDCHWTTLQQDAQLWPRGSFALPQTAFDCPTSDAFPWFAGTLTFTHQSNQVKNLWSPQIHLKGPLDAMTLTLGSCTKMESFMQQRDNDRQLDWPQGNYCIYRTEETCPDGMKSAQIEIPSQNMSILITGSAMFLRENGHHVILQLCCKQSDVAQHLTQMYTKVPFLFIKNSQACPTVSGMSLIEEWLHFGVDAQGYNITLTHGRLTFCYYQPIDTCYYEDDSSGSYEGSVNFTQKGACVTWDIFTPFRIDIYPFMEFTVVDNYCTSLVSFNDRFITWRSLAIEEERKMLVNATEQPPVTTAGPVCLAVEDYTFTPCGIPQCGFAYDKYKVLDKGFPARQKQGTWDMAWKAMDALPDTCSTQIALFKPWWQVDLQRVENVAAIFIRAALIACLPRLATVSVGLRQDDFLTGSAPYCNRNFSMAQPRIFFECEQPVTGQFITLHQVEHWEHDTRPYLTESFCISLCEIKIYINESRDTCGEPLGQGHILPIAQINVSSNGQSSALHTTLLYAQPGWCANADDINPFIQINLFRITSITGFVTQGSPDPQNPSQATSFYVAHGLFKEKLVFINDGNGKKKVFSRKDAYPSKPLREVLDSPIQARFIKFNIQKWEMRACLRVKVIGCQSDTANVALGSTVVASSALWPIQPLVLTDGLLDTCFRTLLEDKPWIKITLPDTYLIEGVILKTDYTQSGTLPKMCEDRNNLGATYAGFINETWSGLPCQRWDVQFPHSHGQGAANYPEGNLTLAENFCRNPDFEKNTWCYTLNPDWRWQLCNVSSCDSYYYNVDIRTSVSNELGELDTWTHCGTAHIHGSAQTGGGVCDFAHPASSIAFIARERSFLILCEIEVLLHNPEPPVVTTEALSSTIACPVSSFLSSIPSNGVYPAGIALGPRSSLAQLCVGKSQCVLPHQSQSTQHGDNSMEQHSLSLVCTPRGEKTCARHKTTPGLVLSKTDYLSLIDQQRTCTWTIEATAGHFVMLNISKLALAPKEEPYFETSYLVDPGSCRDALVVSYLNNGNAIETSMNLLQSQLLISPHRQLSVQISTCYRISPKVIDNVDLRAEFEEMDCPGCSVLQTCSGVSTCTHTCGHILSPAFPNHYGNDMKCTWLITVSSLSYIQLTFSVFDIFEVNSPNCLNDRVTIYNLDPPDENGDVQERLIDSFCNTNRPPNMIESTWNTLKIELTTDSANTDHGFWARYRAVQYKPPSVSSVSNGSFATCRNSWLAFNTSCYSLEYSPTGVTWIEAEEQCLSLSSSLASIQSEEEMLFLHAVILKEEVFTSGIYIGLTDRAKDGIWQWLDKSPLVYSNWQVGSSSASSQPDGSTLEDCAYIKLDGLKPSRNWHDVPCALSDVNYFICKYSATDINMDAHQVDWPYSESNCPPDLTECRNGECILPTSNCDEQDTRSTVPQFKCDNGIKVPLAFYCDFKEDCSDGSDEHGCVHRECKQHEFRCSNGQCIEKYYECDLLPQCLDSSDEQNCAICRNSFQCYDGTCLPLSMVCDGVTDCPGAFKEDEDSCRTQQYHSCLDYRMDGFTQSGRYIINPQNKGEMEVECDFTTRDNQVRTVIHHDSEHVIKDARLGTLYYRNLTYFVNHDLIASVKVGATRCEQHVWFECPFSGSFGGAYWYNIRWQQLDFEYDEPQGDPPCICRFREKACDELGNYRCECASDKRYVVHDSGFIRDTQDLPIMGLSLTKTGSAEEYAMHQIGPLMCYHAFEAKQASEQCANLVAYQASEKCLYDLDPHGYLRSCRDGTHLQSCEEKICPSSFVKCPNSYCVAIRLVCDGNKDCPMGEDEVNCDSYSCPGLYHCLDSKMCLPLSQRCDGTKQCIQGDDEDFCDGLCPPGCTCKARAVSCVQAGLTHIPTIQNNTRFLDLRANKVQPTAGAFLWLTSLAELILANNDMRTLLPEVFLHLENLYMLDLSDNRLVVLRSRTFRGLTKLRYLILEGNKLEYIEPFAFKDLWSVSELILRNMHLTNLTINTLADLKSIRLLNLSKNNLESIEPGVFRDITHIRRLSFVDNYVVNFAKSDFQSLQNLDFLESDDYMFCCFAGLPTNSCLPLPDEFSSCLDLMKNNILRAFLWILGTTALIGNVFSISFQTCCQETISVSSFLTANLAASDFLFGVYMICIASVDVYFRGTYIENATRWKESGFCQLLGCLATVSSECSVLILLTITCDRLKNIAFPFSNTRLTIKKLRWVMGVVWILATVIGVIPLIPSDYFKGQFYSRSSVCVSIHLTTDTPPGWEYSVAIFHVLNFTTFMFILIAYGYMYTQIRKSGMAAGTSRSRELASARKMALIVFTDFCCWFPVNLMGILAMGGVHIPAEMYAWVVVFILPVNSAVNPIIYSALSIQKNKKLGKFASTRFKSSRRVGIPSCSESSLKVILWDMDEEFVSFKDFLALEDAKDVTKLFRIIKETVRVMSVLHSSGHFLGKLNADSIMVERRFMTKTPKVTISSWPNADPLSSPDDQRADDIEQLGRLVSYVVRTYTQTVKLTSDA